MPDFGPYLIFCLYLSRMQKYAFFPVCANILGKILLPPAFFLAFRPAAPQKVDTERWKTDGK